MPNTDTLTGWTAICEYLGISRHLVIQRGYPVYTMPFSQAVWASRSELDIHSTRLREKSTPVSKRTRHA